jgi:hypothetical protein
MGLIEELLASVDERLELAREIQQQHPERTKTLRASAREDLNFVQMFYSLQRYTNSVRMDHEKLMTRAQQQRFA